jgi:hypothetical protein
VRARKKLLAVRDLVVREALAAMARDAAKRFRELIAAGEEIPYEVREPGDGSPLCEYEPLTDRFVRDHAAALRDLDSFGAACAALEAADLAGPYLERMGVAVPDDPRKRAELAAVAVLCRMWADSADFSLGASRVEAAIAEVELSDDVADGEVEVVVPLRGLQMPVARLELPMATIVSSEAVDVPPEARASDGLGAAPWEPTFLAVARLPIPDEGEDGDEVAPRANAVEAFRRLITTLRLYKPGGVALGPHAWTRLPGDRWRRISTGAGKPRPGGYRLAETEVGELAAFARAIDSRPAVPAAHGRALSRFEAGLERNVVIEALNDHLLALRFVLEGGGPAQLGLSMRVASLCAEPEHRGEVKAVVDHAIGLERELWSGEPAASGGTRSPAETAAELEELTRAILKDAACGHLGTDLRTTADEILLADGLAVGDGVGAQQRGATEEWALAVGEGADDEELAAEEEIEPIEHFEEVAAEPEYREELDEEIEPEERITVTRLSMFEQELKTTEPAQAAQPPQPAPISEDASPVVRLIEQTRAERRAHHDRVANLFPRPETTEWNVREIAYDRRRRAEVS